MSEEQKMEVLPPSSRYDEHVSEAEARSLEFMNPKRWQAMEVMARTFVNAGALPKSIDTAPKLIMVFQAGYEAGLQPLESLNSFYFVNGKLAMYGEMVISQVKKAGHIIQWGVCSEKEANVKIIRGDTKEEMSGNFTMEMAEKRGLTKDSYGKDKDVWRKFPDNMLKFKVFNSVAKFIVPDALHGIPIKEELEATEVEDTATKKEANVTEQATVVAGHKSLEETLSEKPKDEVTDAEVVKPEEESGAAKAMRSGMAKVRKLKRNN